MHTKGTSQISIENLLSHSTEKIRRVFVFHEVCGIEKNNGLDGGGERVSRFSVKNSLCRCVEEFHWGTP